MQNFPLITFSCIVYLTIFVQCVAFWIDGVHSDPLSQIISWTWGWAATRAAEKFNTAPVSSLVEAGKPSPTWASLHSTPLHPAASEAPDGVPTTTTSSVWWVRESWGCHRHLATSPPRRLRRAAAWVASHQTWSRYTDNPFLPTRPVARYTQNRWRSTTARPRPRLCLIRAPTTTPPPNRAWTEVSFPWSQTTTSSITRGT